MPMPIACGLRAVDQPIDRAPADADRGDDDQRDLGERDQRLGLAVAEAMVVVGRHARRCARRAASIRLAIRSSAVSASEPSIAVESVCIGGPGLERRAGQRERDAGQRGAGRVSRMLGGDLAPWSWVEQAFGPAAVRRG